jgi:methylmalonyl-CoA/ethylmalonyl-CoA epimerase
MSQQQSVPEKRILNPSAFCQIGIVVENIDETVKYYTEMFGFGPYEIKHVDYSDATYYGQPAGYRGKRAFFRLGNIEIELVELVDGKTIHEDFLKEHGEGLHHIGFQVESLGESVSNAEQAGFQVTQGFSRPDGSGFAYLDSDKTGGVIFELIQPPPEVKEN